VSVEHQVTIRRVLACEFAVGRNRLRRCEVQALLHWQAQRAADVLQFQQADAAKFRLTEPKVAQAEGNASVEFQLSD
jgi:hypothetical protein